MYPAPTVSAIIAEHVSTVSSVPPKERLQILADRITDLSYANRQCSLVLNKDYYCYVYLDPRKPGRFKYKLPSVKIVSFDYEPYYVGKGKGNRINGHLTEAKRSKKTTRKLNIIRKIQAAGLEPIRIATPTKVDEALALALEIDLIAGIGRHCDGIGPLANLDCGGNGIPGHRHTEAHKCHMSRIHRGKRMYEMTDEVRAKISKTLTGRSGRKHTDEAKHKMSVAAKGRKMSEESKQINRLAHLGIPNTEEQKKKISAAMKRIAAQPNSYTKIERTCDRCGRSGRGPGFQRWHFDRCRLE
jgi:hypothetical protein